MSKLKLGQYIHGNSLMHQLDPRTKIICCILLVVAVLLNYRWYYLFFYVLLIAAAIRQSGLSGKYVLGSLRSIRYLLLVTFILQAMLTPGEPILKLGILKITPEGLTHGAVNLFRLLILYLGSMVLLMTTTPLKFSAGLEALLQPLNRLKIPVHRFSTILSIAFRFIPTLIEEATTIKKAQRSRGAPYDSPQLKLRLKSYMAVLIPLFEASLLRAEDLGEAMDSRGYTGHPNRVRMSSLQYKNQDRLVLIFMIMVLGLSLIISSLQ